jgi:hypothetical protein
MANIGFWAGVHGRAADYAFRTSRHFFERGDKSDNKAYRPWELVDPAHWPADLADKISGRSEDRRTASDDIKALRAMVPSIGPERVAHGRYLRREGMRFGNCGEMTCVALSYAADFSASGTPLWLVRMARPADHHFMLIGPRPHRPDGAPPRIIDLPYLMASAPEHPEATYAVDVWAGVCCHASEYAMRLSAQLQKWSGKGKHVWYNRTKQWVDPAGPYLTGLLQADMTLMECTEGISL